MYYPHLTGEETEVQKNEATCPSSHSKWLCFSKSALRYYESSAVRKQNPITQQGESTLLLNVLVLDLKSPFPIHKLALTLGLNPPAASLPVTPPRLHHPLVCLRECSPRNCTLCLSTFTWP